MPSPDNRIGRAEELFAEYLVIQADGKGIDFEAWLEPHGELVAELKALHGEWAELESLRERLERPERKPWNPLAGFTTSSRGSRPATPEGMLEEIHKRGQAIERYRFHSEVGRGGMGVVLQVHDEDLRRDLAMKVILEGQDPSSGARVSDTRNIARFVEEAQVTGQLDHPGIVPVHEVGLDAEGKAFFTMKLVHGQDLSKVFELVKSGREEWTLTRALGVMLKVCEAMAYAHSKGVVHRDLKPANVMVGDFGAVYVMDWGLARIVERNSDLPAGLETVRNRSESGDLLETLDGDVIGTPAYMSPEQAQGHGSDIGPLTDVYAVGAMLYHLLTGRMPNVDSGDGRRTVMLKVRTGGFTPIEKLTSEVPGELVAVTEKAMALDPGERYATMSELSDDLRAFLEGRVVRAFETGAVAEMKKWVRRNRSLATAIAAGILMALIGLGSTALVQSRARAKEAASKEALTAINAELEGTNTELETARNQAKENEVTANLRAEEAERQREAADRVADFLVGLFQSPDPAVARGKEITVKEVLDLGVESIRGELDLDPLVRSRLMEAMGSAHASLGNYAESEELFVENLELLEPRLPATDARVLRAQSLVGRARVTRGDLEALPYLMDVRDRAIASLGPLHVESIQVRLTYLNALSAAFDFEAVAELIEPLLEDIGFVFGQDHSLYLAYLEIRADSLMDLGKTKEAEEAYLIAYEKNVAALGKNHPTAISHLTGLASYYFKMDNIPEATKLFEEALALGEQVFGEDHVFYLTIMNDLAQCYTRAFRFDESEAMQLEALDKRLATFGEDHDDVLNAYNGLATNFLYAKRFEEAEASALKGYEGALARYGPDNVMVYSFTTNLAHAVAGQGRDEEAEALFLEALNGRRTLQGATHQNTLQVLWMLAHFYKDRGRMEAALEMATELVRGTPEYFPRYGERVRLETELRSLLGKGEGE